MKPLVWLVIFVALQIADGVLTYAGVEKFGASAEGNPILATWMMLAGEVPALLGAKLLACGCGAVLYAAGVHRVLIGLSALYLFAAVVPWVHIFMQVA
ncbi:MAG TPA: DUF5658 family protein [Vicinamibacterales bacterium]|nr:DUF5658 family protein [Vicinamibacterales bacterium]